MEEYCSKEGTVCKVKITEPKLSLQEVVIVLNATLAALGYREIKSITLREDFGGNYISWFSEK